VTDLALGVVAGGTASEIAALEALPVQSIWAGGHVASPNGSPEAMVGLARLASLTDRVRIGTSILLLPCIPLRSSRSRLPTSTVPPPGE